MNDNRKTIRNIDPEVLLDARIYALQEGMTLGELVSESLVFYISGVEEEVIGDDASAA